MKQILSLLGFLVCFMFSMAYADDTASTSDTTTVTVHHSTAYWQNIIQTAKSPVFDFGPVNQSTTGIAKLNFIMDIHIPNHVDYLGTVLSYDDFQTLKTNIGIFAAVNISTTTQPVNTNYCDLANAIWNGQDDAFKAKYNKDLVVPVSCSPAVPEFPFYVMIILVVAITSAIVLSARSGLKYK